MFVQYDVGLAATRPGGSVRHNTATGFVVHSDAIALHWHARVEAWLPPGGHIEPNEDPVEAVLREVFEETGLTVEVVPQLSDGLGFESVEQIEPPRTILVEDVEDEHVGPHQHIDMIYFTRVVAGAKVADGRPVVPKGWIWATADQLRRVVKYEYEFGQRAAPPDDVRTLGLRAIEAAQGMG